MRSLFKISLAVLALGILVVAGSVQAQDSGMQKPTLQITGNFAAAFGQENFDKTTNVVCATAATCTGGQTISVTTKAWSEWTTAYEHRIRFVYGTDDFQAKLMIRSMGDSAGSNNGCNSATGLNIGTAGANAGTGGCQGTNNSGSGSTVPGYASATGAQTTGQQPLTGGWAFVSNVYGTVSWKPIKPLLIEFGRFEGISATDPLSANYYMANAVMNSPETFMNYTGRDGINFTYDVGILRAGLIISSQCIPRCSTGNFQALTNAAGTTAVTMSPIWSNTMSLVPYVDGKVGDLAFRVQAPQTQGDATVYVSDQNTLFTAPNTATGSTQAAYSSKTRTQTGSGYDVGVAFTGVPGMVFAADILSFNDPKDSTFCQVASNAGTPNTSTANSCKDWQRDAISAKFEMGGLQVGYYDQNTDDGKGANNSKQEDTYLKVHYMFPVGPGIIGPEYTMANLGKRQLTAPGTTTATGSSAAAAPSGGYDGSYKDISLSMIRLAAKIIF